MLTHSKATVRVLCIYANAFEFGNVTLLRKKFQLHEFPLPPIGLRTPGAHVGFCFKFLLITEIMQIS